MSNNSYDKINSYEAYAKFNVLTNKSVQLSRKKKSMMTDMASAKLATSAIRGKIGMESVAQAHERIKPYLHMTPIFQCQALNSLCAWDNPVKIFCKGMLGMSRRRSL